VQFLSVTLLEKIPEWFRTITIWMVASIVGVKKIGDYLQGLIAGVKAALKKSCIDQSID